MKKERKKKSPRRRRRYTSRHFNIIPTLFTICRIYTAYDNNNCNCDIIYHFIIRYYLRRPSTYVFSFFRTHVSYTLLFPFVTCTYLRTHRSLSPQFSIITIDKFLFIHHFFFFLSFFFTPFCSRASSRMWPNSAPPSTPPAIRAIVRQFNDLALMFE